MRGHGWPLALALLAALLIAPATADAAPVTAIALLHETQGRGGVDVYHPGNATITVGRRDAQSVGVGISQGSTHLSLIFWAPPGEAIGPGTYADAMSENPTGTRPGLFYDGDDCTYSSEFEIKDLAVAPDGTVQRLWAIFEMRCHNLSLSTFGEVRVNEPAPPGALVPIPSLVRWPDRPAGSASQDVPITVIATAPTAPLQAATVAGAGARSFSVGRDDCAGRALPAFGACQVWVRAAPQAPGEQSAAVEVAGGPEVGLEAFGRGGRTRMVLQSDPGDPAGQGRSVTLGPADAEFWARTLRPGNFARLDVARPDGSAWLAILSVPLGQKLAPGHYDEAPGDDRPHFFAGVADASCSTPIDGTFDVSSLTFDPDDNVRSFGVSFVQHCKDAPGSLHGTVEYEAGDATPPARWMRRGPVVPLPDTSAAACAGATRLVRGGRHSDRLVGGPGRDHLVGGAGADRLRGGGGDDCLDGGPGRDVLDCGRGEDIAFVGRGDRVRGCERIVRRR